MPEIIKEYVSDEPFERKYTFKTDDGEVAGYYVADEELLHNTEREFGAEPGSARERADEAFDGIAVAWAKASLVGYLRSQGRSQDADDLMDSGLTRDRITIAPRQESTATPELADE